MKFSKNTLSIILLCAMGSLYAVTPRNTRMVNTKAAGNMEREVLNILNPKIKEIKEEYRKLKNRKPRNPFNFSIALNKSNVVQDIQQKFNIPAEHAELSAKSRQIVSILVLRLSQLFGDRIDGDSMKDIVTMIWQES